MWRGLFIDAYVRLNPKVLASALNPALEKAELDIRVDRIRVGTYNGKRYMVLFFERITYISRARTSGDRTSGQWPVR